MNKSTVIKSINIVRIQNDKKFSVRDKIIDEDILIINVNGENFFNLIFSMTDTEKLAAGFLFTQGIVHKRSDILKIDFIEEKKQCNVIINKESLKRLENFDREKKTRGSSGGTLLKPESLRITEKKEFFITHEQVLSLIEMHGKKSELFHLTGAVHSAGICDRSGILSYYEDIGRHNALDKMAGDVFLNRTDTSDKILTLSCRMSLEIIGKVIKAGMPIVISNAAPTLSALKIADKAGLTMIGFARNKRFNIYTHERRIKI